MSRILVVCTTDSMIWNFLIPHIKELEKHGHYVECACSKTGLFFEELEKQHGIKMNEICCKRTPYSFKNLKAYRKLKNLIKANNFDTIFCHEPVGGALGRLAGNKMKCRVVYMAHGFHFYKGAPKSRKVYYWIEKWLSKYTDTLVTINQEDYDASLKFKAKKCVKVNGVGIDTSKFIYHPNPSFLRKELNLVDDCLIFLSVGELIKRKNHESFIKAISLVENPKIVYVIAGEGEMHSKLLRTIDRLGLSNRVFLLGFRRDVSQLCNSADVFVLPSMHEGLSVALMEAMSCGKPVIASDIRGNSDLVDEKGGILVKTLDIDGYKKAINSIVPNIFSFGEYNRNKIQSFDIMYIVPQILSLFN